MSSRRLSQSPVPHGNPNLLLSEVRFKHLEDSILSGSDMTTEFGSLIRQMARCVHILLLFAGPNGDHDGLGFYIESWGGKVTAFDTERSPDHDLLRDDIWDAIEARIKNGDFDGN